MAKLGDLISFDLGKRTIQIKDGLTEKVESVRLFDWNAVSDGIIDQTTRNNPDYGTCLRVTYRPNTPIQSVSNDALAVRAALDRSRIGSYVKVSYQEQNPKEGKDFPSMFISAWEEDLDFEKVGARV